MGDHEDHGGRYGLLAEQARLTRAMSIELRAVSARQRALSADTVKRARQWRSWVEVHSRGGEDAHGLPWAAIAARAHRGRNCSRQVSSILFRAGICLQETAGLPATAKADRIEQALQLLDEAVWVIRDQEFKPDQN